MTLHFYDAQAARKIIALVIDRIPYGSYVILSVGQLDGDSGEQFSGEYDAAPLYHHGQDDVASFLEGLEPVGPASPRRTSGVRLFSAWTAAGEATSGRP